MVLRSSSNSILWHSKTSDPANVNHTLEVVVEDTKNVELWRWKGEERDEVIWSTGTEGAGCQGQC